MGRFDRSFKSLADPSRRAILRMLRDKPLTAGQLAERIGLTPNALSFHLRILRDADLVFSRRCGQYVLYSLNTSVVEDVVRFVWEQFAPVGDRNSARASGDRAPKPGDAGSDNREIVS